MAGSSFADFVPAGCLDFCGGQFHALKAKAK